MEDDRLIPLSYISQYYFCKRRAGLLLVERQWNENEYTAAGRIEHEKVHIQGEERRRGAVYMSDMPVKSQRLNLFGRCDMTEAYPDPKGSVFPFLDEKKYILFPIEYKHGNLRSNAEYELQLCAQALCLEEMYNCRIERGALFYIGSHRRKEVVFTDEQRALVEKAAEKLYEMSESGEVPKAESSAKCLKCSLRDICMPDLSGSADEYMKKIYSSFREEAE